MVNLPNGYTHRQASMDDFEFVRQLNRKVAFEAVTKLAGEWPEKFQSKYIRKDLENPDMQIIMHEDKPMGCFCITDMGDHISLQSLYIDPPHQGQGIATKSSPHRWNFHMRAINR